MPQAIFQQAGHKDCGRCLCPLAEHETVVDSWGDEVRVCAREEDYFDTDRERAHFARRAGVLQ